MYGFLSKSQNPAIIITFQTVRACKTSAESCSYFYLCSSRRITILLCPPVQSAITSNYYFLRPSDSCLAACSSDKSALTHPPGRWNVCTFPSRWPQVAPFFPPCKIVILEILEILSHHCSRAHLTHLEPRSGLGDLCLQVYESKVKEWKPCHKPWLASSTFGNIWRAKNF